MKTLPFATAAIVLCLVSPALAWTHLATQGWVCGRYEYAKRCNAELNMRTHRCGCLTR